MRRFHVLLLICTIGGIVVSAVSIKWRIGYVGYRYGLVVSGGELRFLSFQGTPDDRRYFVDRYWHGGGVTHDERLGEAGKSWSRRLGLYLPGCVEEGPFRYGPALITQGVTGLPLWIPLCMLGMLLVWSRCCLVTKRDRPGFCRTCGYDLTGLPTNRCPECGTICVRNQK